MKYLTHYTEEKTTKALDEAGAFFAFNNEQFNAQKVEGETYNLLGAGLVCPTHKARELQERLRTIHKEGIAADIAENGKEAIIRRELHNYEAFYTGEIDDTFDALEDYEVTREEIWKVYQAEPHPVE